VALLTRYPIVGDVKVPLPELSRGDDAAKCSMAAELLVGERRVRIVNVHLESGLSPDGLEQQLRFLLEATRRGLGEPSVPAATVMAGDFNSFGRAHLRALARALDGSGFVPAFDRRLRTFSFAGLALPLQLDHVFVKGPVEVLGAVRGPRGGSDHYPLRVDLLLRGDSAPPSVAPREEPPLLCPVPITRAAGPP
jgi:endonuclease/exonuclease/phosphatase family metal-dependent hydrolase